MVKGSLSVSDKLLLAASKLEQAGKQIFSAEDLVVAAWKLFPDAFGLAGYADDSGNLIYPDSNRVFAEIMGSKPIRSRGLLSKVGSKMYQITAAGRDRAAVLSGDSGKARAEKISIFRQSKEYLKRIFESKAVEKILNNRMDDVTFYDACSFWGITPRSSAMDFEGKTANLESMIRSAQDAMKDRTASFDHGGQTFGVDDLEKLMNVHRLLLERFKDEISVIRKRNDERKV